MMYINTATREREELREDELAWDALEEIMTINKYKEYTKVRQQIEIAQLRLKKLSGEILEEMKDMTVPIKTDSGMFSKVKRVSWKYSKSIQDFDYSQNLKLAMAAAKTQKKVEDDELKDLQVKEQKDGTAESSESVSLRFTKKS